MRENFCEIVRTVVISLRSKWKRSAETDHGSMFPVFQPTAICLAMERLTDTKSNRAFNACVYMAEGAVSNIL